MNNEQLLRIFGEVDEEFIEQANEDVNAWLQSNNGVAVRADEPRKFPLKAIIASVACVAAVLFGVVIVKNFIFPNSIINPNGSGYSVNPEDVRYYYIYADHYVCSSTQELVTSADAVFIGKVTDISFKALDQKTGLPPTNETEEHDVCINTFYTVEVETSYKGATKSDVISIRVWSGIEDEYVEEQLKALGKYASEGIGIDVGMPEIKIGEEYLFSLRKRDDGVYHLMNQEQGVFSVSEPYSTDIFGTASAKDIISYFGEDKWEEFKKYMNIFEYEKEDAVFANDILVDWVTYNSLDELIGKSESVTVGKVTGVSFEVGNFWGFGRRTIATVYTIEMQSSYKGGAASKIKLRVPGGLKKDRYIEEQLFVLGTNGMDPVITWFEAAPTLNVGEEYLFLFNEFGGEEKTLAAFYQSVYPLKDPEEKVYGRSAKDIISYFGEDKWEEFLSGSSNKTGLSEEQLKQLEELRKKAGLMGSYPYQEAVILGKIDPNAPKLDLQTAKKIIARCNSYEEILSEFEKVQKYPDYSYSFSGRYGGADEYWLNESGSEKIIVIDETSYHSLYDDGKIIAEIFYGSYNPDGSVKYDETLFSVGGKYEAPPEDPTASYPYQEAVIRGEIDPNAPKLDLKTAKKIIAKYDSFEEILSEFKKVQKYPDYAGGSGVSTIIYHFGDEGGLVIILEQGEINYQTRNPDGTFKSNERLYPKTFDKPNQS